MELRSQLVGIGVGELAALPLHGPRPRRDPDHRRTDDARQADDLPMPAYPDTVRQVMSESMSLAEAAAVTRTGDVLLFRGRSAADRAIRAFTNSPVNHVGMVIAIDDLPPLFWHAELGQSLPDVWSGERQRGTQLHRLTDAVSTWHHQYGQRAWMRQIDIDVTPEMEDEVLRTVNELDGRTFPRPGSLVKGWMQGPGSQEDSSSSSCSAPRWSRSPTSGWACSTRSARRTGTTPASSGAATSWP